MKTIDPFATESRVTHDDLTHRVTYSASRVLVGHCPACGNVLVVFNDGESWPLVGCSCGWNGDTLSLDHRIRYERAGVVAP